MSKRTDSLYATVIGIVLAIIVASVFILVVRFVFGGPEDDWICSGGQWVRHGNPAAQKPVITCVSK